MTGTDCGNPECDNPLCDCDVCECTENDPCPCCVSTPE
jgi:hypothetical protein